MHITLDEWRDSARYLPHQALWRWGALEPEVQEQAQDDLLSTWERATRESAVQAIEAFLRISDDAQVRIGWERVREAWVRMDERKSGASYAYLRNMPQEVRRRLPVTDQAQAWRNLAARNPADALSEFSYFMYDEVRAELSADELAAAYRRTLGSEHVSIFHFSKLPAEARAQVTSDELLAAWRLRAKTTPALALKDIALLPEDVRGRITSEEIDAAWGAFSGETSYDEVVNVLTALSPGVRAHIRPARYVAIWDRVAEKRSIGDCLAVLQRLPEAARSAIPGERIADQWKRYVKQGPRDAMDVLARMPESARAALVHEDVAGVWQRRFRQSPESALNELRAAPEDIRRRFSPADLAPLLSSENSKVRLAAITAASRLREASEPERVKAPARARAR